MITDVLARWQADPETSERIAHVETVAERPGIFDDLDLHPDLAARLGENGIERLYRHQARAVRLVRDGKSVVVVAGTASGKSLCYQIPIAESALEDPANTALLLFPTKALARDQLRGLHRLVPELSPAAYDGDTDQDSRVWARRHANAILTNPDMLHIGILPSHGKWAQFFRRLRFVVIDEVHALRGVFGSHVSLILRRLRRIARFYGADPTFIGTSATIGNPGELMAALTGTGIEVVDQDTAPAGTRHHVLWNPELEDDDTRRSSLAETADLFAELIRAKAPTIAFVRSRKGVELVHRWARDRLGQEHAHRISPYRAGYLAEERRRIEEELFAGDLLGVVATNALELGIDVGGLEAAVVSSFPGTVASYRQQTGRAGRGRDESLAVLVAGQDALDQWFMNHPEDLFARPSEAAVVNPGNPRLVRSHLGCAAYEVPLLSEDAVEWFGPEVEQTAADLVAEGQLRIRNKRLLWAGREAPAPRFDIRSAGGRPFAIIDPDGEIIGTVDDGRVFSQAHPGAVYLHQGDSFLVESLDLDQRVVRVTAGEVEWFTQPDEDTNIEVLEVLESGAIGGFDHFLGRVEVEHRVVGFKKKRITDRSVISHKPLDLPPRRFTTEAVWFVPHDGVIARAGVDNTDLPGTLHAAEHTAIAMLPLFAICDRWDIGGLSTPWHPVSGSPIWFIYDGYDGGIGIASMAFATGERHLAATLDALRRCPCAAGCPSCVQSPKCGNFNEPLDKAGAIRLLEAGLG